MSSNFIFNFKKLKYNLLDELLTDKKLSNTINIVLDVDTIFELFRVEYYAKMIEKLATSKGALELTAEFYNFIAHYKHYFEDKLELKCKFYFLYNSGKDRLRESEFPELWEHRKSKTVKENFIYFSINKIKTISEYFSDISIIDGGDIHYTLIPKVLIDEVNGFKSNTTLFLNENPFYSQYLGILKDSYIINPTNNSYAIIGVNEYFKRFLLKNKYKHLEDESNLDDSLIPFHVALNEFEKLPLLVKSKRTTVKAILEIHQTGNYENLLGENVNEFEKRVEISDCLHLAEQIKEDEVLFIVTQLNNNIRVSTNKLFTLNNQYFKNVIRLDWLCNN